MRNLLERPVVVIDTPRKARIMNIALSIKIAIIVAILVAVFVFLSWSPLQIGLFSAFAVAATFYQFVFLRRWYRKGHTQSPFSYLLEQLG